MNEGKDSSRETVARSQDEIKSPSPARLACWGLAQGAVVLAAGLNLRIMTCALDMAPFLRWREVISMLVITPLSLVFAFFMMDELERSPRRPFANFGLFLFSAFLIAVAMGIHEPVNILQYKMRLDGDSGPAGATMYFLDEVLSHWAFFAGYAGVCVAWAWSQSRNPVSMPISLWMWVVFSTASLAGGAGITASLWGQPLSRIVCDLIVIAVVILCCEVLRWRGGARWRQPVTWSVQLSNIIAFVALLIRGLF